MIEKCLEIQLENSLMTSAAGGGAPLFTPNVGVTALHAYSDYLAGALRSPRVDTLTPEERAMTQQMSDVMHLCVALWGDVPQLEFETNRNSYRCVRACV